MSARVASPAGSGSGLLDPVRALQHALYRAAKADPGRRFHAVSAKFFRRDVLARAWVQVRRNDGAPGIDAITLADRGLPRRRTPRGCPTAPIARPHNGYDPDA